MVELQNLITSGYFLFLNDEGGSGGSGGQGAVQTLDKADEV